MRTIKIGKQRPQRIAREGDANWTRATQSADKLDFLFWFKNFGGIWGLLVSWDLDIL